MKFRAIINDTIHMRELFNIITTCSRINRNIVINVQPSKFFIQIETEVEAAQCLWCEIDASNRSGFFSEYVMDGVDEAHNQIFLTALAANLVRALSSLRNTSVNDVKLKLVKTDIACLMVEINGIMNNDSDVMCPKIQHAIPVTVAPRSEWKNFNLPLDMDYDLTIVMPSFKSLQGLIDKMKNLAPAVTIYVTLAGELSLVVETDVVTVGSHYKRLQSGRARRPNNADDAAEEVESLTEAACRVDSKKLATLLESLNCFNMKMIANIKHETLFNVTYEMKDNVFMNFVLPAVEFE
ncbi:checkpoint protein HUS1 [Topomyia yanbarensis]|uniref:checkpoint protein HUS1 n=1 Tax=Topomyia yanbarensis TaxID=2498891 RepID=UPI00273C43C5|nr:checkpoint protein HUS1 [Topomyia yanbarensis]